jgi:prepilin-type processing-associated H-X9-DG protein
MRGKVFRAALVVALGLLGAGAAIAQDAAKAIPADGLAVYAEFDGLDAHAEAWKKTAAYRMLTETTAGAMLEELIGQLADRAPAGAGRPVSGAEVVAIAKHVLHHGASLGVLGPFGGGPDDRAYGVLVLRGAGAGADRALFDRVIRGRIPREVPSRTVTLEGREVTLVRPETPPSSWAFWTEGQDVIVTFGRAEEAPRAVFAALKGDGANASTHPIRQELARDDEGYEVIARGFVDVTELPPLPPPLVQLGLDGIKRADYRWGFRGEAIQTITRLVAPAPRRGLLTLLDQPTFGADSLPPLPSGVNSFTVLSLDWGKVLDAIATVPDGEQVIAQVSDEFRRRTGLRLREDLLEALGPRWAFYAAPQEMQAPINPFMAMGLWVLRPPKLTAVAEVRKPEEFRRDIDELMAALNDLLRQAVPGDRPAPRFEKLGDGRGYVLNMPPEVLPLPAGVRPTLRIGEEYAALAISPEAAKSALEARPSDREREMFSRLGDDLVALSVSDPRTMTPEVIANLPFFLQLLGRSNDRDGTAQALGSIKVDPELIPAPDAMRKYLFPSVTIAKVNDQGLTVTARQSVPSLNPISSGPVAIALLLPAVQSAREAARRAQCVNNLKQMALAFHNYHSANNSFPAHAIYSKDGKPLLSWRVAILPYIEQEPLYREFHLDEPWDSPHNKALIERMPPTYACPTAPVQRGMTPYQVAVGKGAMFEGKQGIGIAEVTDGTSNTILVAESKTPVTWTKPDDLELDPDGPPPRIGSYHPGGANTAFADGSVRFIKDTINQGVLRALFTRNGGEVISADQY